MALALSPSGNGHLLHLVVLGGWFGVVAVAVGVEDLIGRRRRRHPRPARAGSSRPAPINAAAFISTWPPPRPPLTSPPAVEATVAMRRSRIGLLTSDGGSARSERRIGALLQACAVGTMVAAATHTVVMPDHFAQSWLYGGFFLVALCGQLALAGLLLGRPGPRVVRAAVAGSAALVGLWAFTRYVGVPLGPDRGATEPVGTLDVAASVGEVVTLVCGSLLLGAPGLVPAWRWRQWSTTMRSALGVVVVVAGYLLWVSPKG
ncbi:MAG TPA: hypothetical protein VMU63_10605 [Acidimicrobiales bacterium]|nr:hypothetical protein [Acidimicrobiales bacterium]